MKKQLLGVLVAALAVSSGYAADNSFKQNVKLCLDVAPNSTPYAFAAHFGSSDLFDRGHDTPVIANGKLCVDHDYKSGPKNIFFRLAVLGSNKDALLVNGKGCEYLYNNKGDPTLLTSDYQRTSKENEAWTFRVTSAEPTSEYKYVYNVECEHSDS